MSATVLAVCGSASLLVMLILGIMWLDDVLNWAWRRARATWSRLRTHYSGGHVNLDEDAVDCTIAEMERQFANDTTDDEGASA